MGQSSADGAKGDCIGDIFESRDLFQKGAINKPTFTRRLPAFPKHWACLWENSSELKHRWELYPTGAEGESARTLGEAPEGTVENSSGHHREKLKWPQGRHKISEGKAEPGVLGGLLGGGHPRLLRSTLQPAGALQAAGVTGQVGAWLGGAVTLGPRLFTHK